MTLVRGIAGFFTGLLFGGAALAAIALFVPQIEVEETAKQPASETVIVPDAAVSEPEEPQVATEDEATNEADAPEVETVSPTPDDTQEEAQEETDVQVTPAVTPTQQDVAESQSDTQTPEPNQQTVDVAEEPAAPEPKEPEVAVISETPQVSEPAEVVETPEVTEKPKKIILPTITPEEPVETVDKVEEPEPDTGITVGKKPSSSLPTITQDEPEPEIEAAPSNADFERALELNATPFAGADRPLMGVILRDIGDKGLTVAQLKALNAPLTIAIAVDDPDASARALEYKAAGFEVIAMATDDRNAKLNMAVNSDQVRDAMDVMFTVVPGAIGLLDSTQAKIQKNGRISKTVVGVFVETGHGLITYAKGLNSVDREARAKGVRTAKVSRSLDANSENKSLIVRYLDRASLDAGRDGATIVLGTTAKETVAALAGWLLSSKGKSVALAPASAVLLGN
jgi:uncharacterized protein